MLLISGANDTFAPWRGRESAEAALTLASVTVSAQAFAANAGCGVEQSDYSGHVYEAGSRLVFGQLLDAENAPVVKVGSTRYLNSFQRCATSCA